MTIIKFVNRNSLPFIALLCALSAEMCMAMRPCNEMMNDPSSDITAPLPTVVQGSCEAEQREELVKLLRANHELESEGPLSLQELEARGFIKLGNTHVKPAGVEDPEKAPRLSFVEILMPFAKTGFYASDWSLNEEERNDLQTVLKMAYRPDHPHALHKGLLVVTPGCGGNLSVAQAILKVVSYFHMKGRARGKDDIVGRSEPAIRLASFALDLPGNGMGLHAPDIFLSQEGLVAVKRHVRLLLGHIYGFQTPTFFAGRSLGATQDTLYGQHYDDINGVVSLNFLPSDPELRQNMIHNTEDPEVVKLMGFKGDIELHRSWYVSKQHSKNFDFLNRVSLVPELQMEGIHDPTYAVVNLKNGEIDRSHWNLVMEKYIAADPRRKRLILDAAHNPWERLSVPTFPKPPAPLSADESDPAILKAYQEKLAAYEKYSESYPERLMEYKKVSETFITSTQAMAEFFLEHLNDRKRD